MPKHLRLLLTPTDRTDLMCIACGGFRTELSLPEEHAGIHKRCIKGIHAAKRSRTDPDTIAQRDDHE